MTGNVTERPFEPGSHVKKEQVLFRIDPRPFQVALAQAWAQEAQAQEAQAKAQLQFAQAEDSPVPLQPPRAARPGPASAGRLPTDRPRHRHPSGFHPEPLRFRYA